jgi:hypothetical protein
MVFSDFSVKLPLQQIGVDGQMNSTVCVKRNTGLMHKSTQHSAILVMSAFQGKTGPT